MAQFTVGLDLGNQTLKRVRLKSSFRSVEVVDYSRIALQQDERPYTERVGEALDQLDTTNGHSDLLATALPGNVVSVRTMELPFADNKRISQTIGFELESMIPFSLDEVVFDYLKLSSTGEGARILMALCQIDQMERWLDVFQGSGIDPRLVGADCLAYSSLAEYLPPPKDNGRMAVVDLGHKLTSVCVIGPEGVEFGRTLSGGGHNATAKLAEAFEIDYAKAEAGKHRGAFVETADRTAQSPEEEKICGAISKSIDVLVRELRQTLTTHRTLTETPVTNIWLCGGGSSVDNLDRYLAEEMNLQVERLRPEQIELEGVERLGDDQGAVTWAKALGLALHAHQGGRRGWLNLRRGQFSFKGDFAAARGKVLHVGVALLILALLGVGNALVSYLSLRSTDETLDERIRETTQAILGKPYDNIGKARAIIRERISPDSNPLPSVTALDSLTEIHLLIPKDIRIRMRDINISPKRIRIEGFTDGFESVEKIKAAMEANECFKEVRTGRTRKTKDEDEVEFELTIVNGC